MLLSSLLSDSEIKYTVKPESDTEISSICNDSRMAEPGSLFVCISGAQTDGHAYAASAYSRGCRVFAVEHMLPLPEDALQLPLPDTRTALADLSAAFYGFPSRSLKIIGITGTKGKTTVALMAAHMLNSAGIPTGYIGTSGIIYGNKVFPAVNTTPESREIQRIMRDMVNDGMKALVMEVSSQGLYLNRVRGICFDTVCFTNLSPDHIGGAEHPSFEHYAASKHRLFTEFGAQTAVYNIDDPMGEYMVSGFGGKLISCSDCRSDADISLNGDKLTRIGGRLGVCGNVHIKEGSRDLPLELPMPGKFNLMNSLIAAAAVKSFGISPDNAFKYLENVSVEGRFQIVDALPGSGATFVVDYAHNGLSLTSALTVLRKYRPKRLICLFGSVGGRTELRRKEMGDAAAMLADFCILTSDNPDFEAPEKIIADIAASFKPGASCDCIRITDRHEAVRYAVSMAGEGDIILLAGKGAENFQLINGEHVPYSDKDALLEAASRLARV